MDTIEFLNKNLIEVKVEVYDKLSFDISQVYNELEGTEYDACQFKLNGKKVIWCFPIAKKATIVPFDLTQRKRAVYGIFSKALQFSIKSKKHFNWKG